MSCNIPELLITTDTTHIQQLLKNQELLMQLDTKMSIRVRENNCMIVIPRHKDLEHISYR